MDLIKIASDMKERGILLKSLTEQIDTTTPAGEMFFHIVGAMAQMERELIRERTRAGLLRARAMGRMNGRIKLAGETEKRLRKLHRDLAEDFGRKQAVVEQPERKGNELARELRH
jgi:DNA invertase Pin-like site-specific DNA recombinase